MARLRKLGMILLLVAGCMPRDGDWEGLSLFKRRTGDIGVGGNGDSIALWLAISALVIAPLLYPLQRRWRLRKHQNKAID